jgi:hypothetical protein
MHEKRWLRGVPQDPISQGLKSSCPHTYFSNPSIPWWLLHYVRRMNSEVPPGFLCKEEHSMQLIKMGETCRVGIRGQALYLPQQSAYHAWFCDIYMTSFHTRWCDDDDDDDGMGFSANSITNLCTTCLQQQLINWQNRPYRINKMRSRLGSSSLSLFLSLPDLHICESPGLQFVN